MIGYNRLEVKFVHLKTCLNVVACVDIIRHMWIKAVQPMDNI